MNNDQNRTVFTGDGVRAVLAFEGGVCLFELTVSLTHRVTSGQETTAGLNQHSALGPAPRPAIGSQAPAWERVNRPGLDYATSREAVLEILLQPRDAAGLPDGVVQLLFSTAVKLRPVAGASKLRGHCWFPPTLTPRLLEACHFRVRPGKIFDKKTP